MKLDVCHVYFLLKGWRRLFKKEMKTDPCSKVEIMEYYTAVSKGKAQLILACILICDNSSWRSFGIAMSHVGNDVHSMREETIGQQQKVGRCCKVETGEYDTAMDSANLSNMLSEHLRACLVLPFLAVYAMFHAVRFRQQKTNKQKSGDCGIYYCNFQTRHIACQRAKLTLMCVHWGIFQQYMPPSMC